MTSRKFDLDNKMIDILKKSSTEIGDIVLNNSMFSNTLMIQNEGVELKEITEILNFTGDGVTVSGNGAKKTINIPGESGYSLTIQDEGSLLTTGATTLNFTGNGVVVSGNGTIKTIYIPGGNISSLTIQDEGIDLTENATILDFIGNGVTVSGTGVKKTINIPGGSDTSLTIQDEGSSMGMDAEILDFTGDGVTLSGTGTKKTINIPGANDYSLTIQDEGFSLVQDATILNFTGNGVTVSGDGEKKTIYIPGGGSNDGSSLIIQNEGSSLEISPKILNFTGNGVTVSGPGTIKTIKITDTIIDKNTDISLNNLYVHGDISLNTGSVFLNGDISTNSNLSVYGTSFFDGSITVGNAEFTGTVTGITNSMVGLDKVDNTSDIDKPVSIWQQIALDLKAPINNPTFTGTVSGIHKSMINLGNVDNTSDIHKPVSSAQQAALDTKQNIINILSNNENYNVTLSRDDCDTVALDVQGRIEINPKTIGISSSTEVEGFVSNVESTFNEDVNISNNKKIMLGNSNDLQIYHESDIGTSKSIISDLNNDSSIHIRSKGDGIFLQKTNTDGDDFEHMLVCRTDGAVEAYYDSCLRFKTESDGCKIYENLDLISNTTSVINNGSLLSLNGDTEANGAIQITCIKNTDNDKKQDGMSIKAYSDTNNIINFVNTSGDLRGYIKGVSSSEVSYVTTSDRRLKQNIENMDSQIDNIMNLRPVKYNWIEDDILAEGFIAQEVHSIYPNFKEKYNASYCSNNENYDDDCPCDASGNPYYYGLDYGKFTPYIIKSIQELKTMYDQKIEQLEERIKTLENN